MLIWVLFKMALRSLVTNKLRTFLTALGIIIGVASVISMISIGEGARNQTQSTISKFGTAFCPSVIPVHILGSGHLGFCAAP